MNGRKVAIVLVLNFLGSVFTVPVDVARLRRGFADNELDLKDSLADESSFNSIGDTAVSSNVNTNPPPPPEVIKEIFGTASSEAPPSDPSVTLPPITNVNSEDSVKDPSSNEDSSSTDVDDDDEPLEFESMQTSPSLLGGGSSIFSLLNLVSALFPASSASSAQTSTTASVSSSTGVLSPVWALKWDIFRAILKFGTSLLGLASSTSTAASG